MVQFLQAMAELKHLYKKNPKDIEDLQRKMSHMYNTFITGTKELNLPVWQNLIFQGPKQKEPGKKEKEEEPGKKETLHSILLKPSKGRRVVTPTYDWVGNNWMKDGEICDPDSEPWLYVEEETVKVLKTHLTSAGSIYWKSEEFRQWQETYGAMFQLYRDSREEEYKHAIEVWELAPANKEAVEKWKEANQNMISIMDFEKDFEPYLYHHTHLRHNNDISHASGGYVRDYSHVSIPVKDVNHFVPLISGESEMLSILAMVVIFLVGVMICFFYWMWCALAAYLFITMGKSGKRRREKKQYARVEEEENDIEREYASD